MKHAREDYNRIQDPLGLIPADEPVFLLRGQDKLAPDTLLYYAQRLQEEGGSPALIQSVKQQMVEMNRWQRNHLTKLADLPWDSDDVYANAKFGFDIAIRLLKSGHRVCRTGWNGKGMWVALTPASTILPHEVAVPDGMSTALVPGPTLRGAARAYAIAECPNGITIGAHIDMRAADGSLVIGWLASQTDMLAEDWMILP